MAVSSFGGFRIEILLDSDGIEKNYFAQVGNGDDS